MKRMLRPTIVAARPGIEAYDIIVRLKRPCARTEFPLVRAEAVRLLGALAQEPTA